MGEVLKILAKGRVKDKELCVELNAASSESGNQSIHLQIEEGRVELGLREFRAIAANIVSSSSKLSGYKREEFDS